MRIMKGRGGKINIENEFYLCFSFIGVLNFFPASPVFRFDILKISLLIFPCPFLHL